MDSQNFEDSQKIELKGYFDRWVEHFNNPGFITEDPISIPHSCSKAQDIEIAGFWVAILAWGQRKTILNKGRELMQLMDGAPHDFIVNHTEKDREKLMQFKHRTFNDTDTLWFLAALQHHYRQYDSLESAFVAYENNDISIEKGLVQFQKQFFFSEDFPRRTMKHISSPLSKSTCKRLNMFLRWMVRSDDRGVDFGLWKQIKSKDLKIPLDVHVDNIARRHGLITRRQSDWQTVLELTNQLLIWDPQDPVKYDFALFGMGVEKRS